VKSLTISLAFLTLPTLRVASQDTVCTTFTTETVACNDQPFTGCSSHASVSDVIVDGSGDFGCMYPLSTPGFLSCPGGTSCPTSSTVTVAANNPYCQQTYTACGYTGDGCIGSGGGGGGKCPPGTPSIYCCENPQGCSGGSPIIVDTMGRGFHLTSAKDGVMFDIAGDGYAVKMAWTTANSGNAFLAHRLEVSERALG